jgi:predicted HTH domain antitoxin
MYIFNMVMSIREHIRELKENLDLSASGSKWTTDEENALIYSIGNNKDITEIAKDHQRTLGGIKSRLREIAVRLIEKENKSIEEVARTLQMNVQEIKDAQKRRSVTRVKQETELDVLKDIRRTLLRIEEHLSPKQ